MIIPTAKREAIYNAWRLQNPKKNFHDLARRFKCTRKTVRRIIRSYSESNGANATSNCVNYTCANNNDIKLIEYNDSQPRTLEEAMAAAHVTDDWMCESWQSSSWTVILKGGLEKTAFRTLLKLKRKVQPGVLEAFEELLSKIDDIRPPIRPPIVLPPVGTHLATIECRDIHIGKLHHKDSRLWSTEKCITICRNAIIDSVELIGKHSIEKTIIVCCDDLLQTDNLSSTTSSGTFVESCDSLDVLVDTACTFLVWVIEYVLHHLGAVHLLSIIGNHDTVIGGLIARYLKAYFRNTPGVTVDAERNQHKAILWRSCLLAWSHGDKISNITRLAAIIPNLFPELYGASKYRYLTMGHIHRSKVARPVLECSDGLTVRWVPSISPPDNYHINHAWVGEEAMQSFVYGEGLVAQYTVRARL